MTAAVQEGRALVLVKALPQPSSKHVETVCCAGVDENRNWKRLYPVRYRHLSDKSKFVRWQWVNYQWLHPTDDNRAESQKILSDSIAPGPAMPLKDRASFLNPIIQDSLPDPITTGRTLALVRPASSKFMIEKKNDKQLQREKAAYKAAARQPDFFDTELEALEPCPFSFSYKWTDGNDVSHRHTCLDWETAATFRRWSKIQGEEEALESMSRVFGVDYPEKGFSLAFGTHSRRPSQWLLVGVVRIDDTDQLALF